MNSNPLLAVWQSYQTLKDCFDIAKVANKHPDRNNLLVKTESLHLQDQANARQLIKLGKNDADELFVLSLWATFERFVRTYLQEKGKKLQEISPTSLASSIYPYFEKEIEFWKAEDLRLTQKHLSTSCRFNWAGEANFTIPKLDCTR